MGGRKDISYQRLSEENRRTINLQQNATIADARKQIARNYGVDQSLVDVISDLMVLDDETLIDDVQTPLDVVIHESERKMSTIDETSLEDVIDRGLEDEPTWQMSCGHGITSENLFGYCWSKLKDGDYKFFCPGLDNGCGKEWNFFEIKWKARLNDDEIIYFESRISCNYVRKQSSFRECPFCFTLCERLAENNARVICTKCAGEKKNETEFCWFCLMPWRRGHFCGQDSIRKTLQTCQTKKISHAVDVPCVRLCVECGLILEHTQGCKQMTCKCGKRFCFVCLTPCLPNGNFQCDNCKVAPRQTV